MKLSIIVLAAMAITSTAAHADTVSDYVTHIRDKGQNATNGSWDIDYVQLIPRAGHPLSANDLKINQELATDVKEQICPPDEQDPENDANSDSNQTTTVTFVSDRLLALSLGFDVSCAAAAHPDNGLASEIFDRKSGEIIDIRDGQPTSATQTQTTSLRAINKIILNALVKQAAIEKKERGDDECDDVYSRDQLSGFTPLDIFVSSKGLTVQNDVPHVAMACQFSVTIPYAKFAKVAPKGSLLAELVAGAAPKPKK